MQSNKGRDTKPEMALRRQCHSIGLRFRVDYPLPLDRRRRRADLTFTRARVAVFLDGCFWHGCPQHFTVAKTNSEFWAQKVARNIERDRETDRLLSIEGWVSIRVWEHDDPISAAAAVAALVNERR